MTDISVKHVDEHANALAAGILDDLAAATASGRDYLLGCPTGRTPTAVYEAIALRLAEQPQPLDRLVLVMMDEYLEGSEKSGFTYVPRDAHNACHRFAEMQMRLRWNAKLPENMHLPQASVWFADPSDPGGYDRRIDAAGGIDFFILASGAGDGHIAFNPPGSPAECRTRIVSLAEQTRRDNMGTFPGFRSLDEVPRHGISVGIATIVASKSAAMLLFGSGKADAFARISRATGYEPDWPATAIHLVKHARILADRDAANRV